MAVTVTYSDKFLENQASGKHNLLGGTLKVALMTPAFSFIAASHAAWTDISSAEIASGNGYGTVTGSSAAVIASAAVSVASHVANITATNQAWTASGGAIASTGAAIVIDTASISSVANTVVMCIDYGADYATPITKTFQLNFSAGLIDIS